MSYWTGLFVPDKYVARLVPAGGADAFVLRLFAWALGFANIYYGMAQRAIDPAVPEIKKKTSVAVSRNMAYHPEVQHSIAEMMLAFDPIGPHLDSVAEDWSAGVDHGAAWPAKLVSAKHHAVDACWRIVEGDGSFWRHRDVPGQRPGAAVPGCALWPLPPGEYLPDA